MPTPTWAVRREAIRNQREHDFNNLLCKLVMASEMEDSEEVGLAVDALRGIFDKMNRKRYIFVQSATMGRS